MTSRRLPGRTHGSAAHGSTAHGSAAHGSTAHGSAAHGSTAARRTARQPGATKFSADKVTAQNGSASPRVQRRRARAAQRSRGSLPLPHLGDWTHDGQPLVQTQLSSTSVVAAR
jgi:hypothetical protein